MIELPEPKCYTHISWLKAPSGCIVTEPHASFPISLFTADQLRTYGDQRAAEAREQMREECMKLFPQPHAEYFGREAVDAIKELS